MLWYGGLLAGLFATSIVTLAAAGAEPPASIQSFTRSSREEQRFYRRGARLQAIGFTSLAAAALLGMVGLAAGMSMLH
jgi:hypothetical protein